ncbi:MAG TPA: DUF998 domain-containing protein [Acidimicrobiia bacterium]|nr:DUF998 domain-containing protein [Acidimicrobiia bacterium]
MELSRVRLAIVAALLISIISLGVAPMILPEGYSVLEHTTSEAAAQGTEGAWLARTGFLFLGIAVFCLAVAKRSWPTSARVLHSSFGLFMIAAGVYSHRPYLEGVSYDQMEDLLHSVAATAMGFGFAAGVLVVGWRRIPRWRITDALALIAALAIPMTMSFTSGFDGLLQRGMFLVAYLWYGLELSDTRLRTSFDTIG